MTYEEYLATKLDASAKIKCIEEAFGVFQDTPEENDSSQSLQETTEKEAFAESECEIIHVYPNANQAPTIRGESVSSYSGGTGTSGGGK